MYCEFLIEKVIDNIPFKFWHRFSFHWPNVYTTWMSNSFSENKRLQKTGNIKDFNKNRFLGINCYSGCVWKTTALCKSNLFHAYINRFKKKTVFRWHSLSLCTMMNKKLLSNWTSPAAVTIECFINNSICAGKIIPDIFLCEWGNNLKCIFPRH